MNSPRLVTCPKCGGPWPRDESHELRGFGWLTGLPRGITPSDIDCVFHDGADGRNRLLVMEAKGPHEEWPIQTGQAWLLRSLARLRGFDVRILRGTLRNLASYRVTAAGIEPNGVKTDPDTVRQGVARWLSPSQAPAPCPKLCGRSHPSETSCPAEAFDSVVW